MGKSLYSCNFGEYSPLDIYMAGLETEIINFFVRRIFQKCSKC